MVRSRLSPAKKCTHCSRPVPAAANYCHFCGTPVRGNTKKYIYCVQCGRINDHVSTYCKHCGSSLGLQKKKTHPLAYALLFLLVIFIVLLFVSWPSPRPSPAKQIVPSGSLTILETTCLPEDDGFRVCANVQRQDGAYFKVHVPGGKDLDNAERQLVDRAVVCEHVGGEEGYRVVRSVLYDASDAVIQDVGRGVLCEKKQETQTLGVPPPPALRLSSVVVHKQFTARDAFRRGRNSGSFTLDFPSDVQSCQFTGTWLTEMSPVFGFGSFDTTPLPQYCHKGPGELVGFFDATTQWVTSDPGYYGWADGPAYDPDPESYTGKMLYVKTCDRQYSGPVRYFVDATVSGVETPTLVVDWTYRDDNLSPSVLFDLFFNCTVSSS